MFLDYDSYSYCIHGRTHMRSGKRRLVEKIQK